MTKPFTPKQVAIAVGVSESSIKRWCDKGRIATRYTAGGHRRIAANGLIQFLRNSKHDLVNPKSLGWPERLPLASLQPEEIQELIVTSLVSGDEVKVRQVAFELFLREHSISSICDKRLAPAFEKIGDLWECGKIEVYQERLACQLSERILVEFRSLLAEPEDSAPVAIGISPEGDLYRMPTTMVELVLRDNGWKATSLGTNIPLTSLAAAIRVHNPRLVWISGTHIRSADQFVESVNRISTEFGQAFSLVLGGQGISPDMRSRMPRATFCETLAGLESFLATEKPTQSFNHIGVSQAD